MIGYLKGEVLDSAPDGRILLGLAGSGGSTVGYSVLAPCPPGLSRYEVGAQAEFFVHTHVREDALELFGFASRDEKELFLMLIGINGIGPRLALGLLSKAPAARLIRMVTGGDKTALTGLPGVGKKTAERIVLELAEPLRKRLESGAFPTLQAPPSRPAAGTEIGEHDALRAAACFADAREALLGLGFREADASEALHKLLGEGAERSDEGAEQLVRRALRELRR